MSRFYARPAQKPASLAPIITLVSLVTFAIFSGVYALSLNGGKMITTPTDDTFKFEQPAWIPPEERAAGAGSGSSSGPVTGQF